MWRLPVSQVHKTGKWSFVQDNGVCHVAARASNGNYLFSEVGAGIKPLALVGMWNEVLNYLAKRESAAIENLIADLPRIYMGISYYVPGQRFIGCFPVHDAIQQITEGVAAFAPGNTLTDVVGAAKDIRDIAVQHAPKKKSAAKHLANDRVVIIFHYLQDKNMVEVGSGKIGFRELYPMVREGLSSMV